MPKCGRKGSGKHVANDQQADVTINDFANSKVLAKRIRKPNSNFLAREDAAEEEVEEFYAKIIKSGDKAWYEKELDEFDCLSLDDDQETDISEQQYEKRKGGKKKQTTVVESNNSGGTDYPLDLWYLLAEYILPEDVQTFACLCKSASYVIKTYKFWIGMYKRYYTPHLKLPHHLQPVCIARPYRLRAYVICSLYHSYSPFVKRLSGRREEDVNRAIRCCCIAFWHHQQGGKWQFFLKFRSPNVNDQPIFCSGNSSTHKKQKKNLWSSYDEINGYYDPLSILEDVNSNPEDGCFILRITCPHYVAISPTIMGSRLVDTRVTVARDMHHRRVQLMFSTAGYQSFNRIPLHMFGCSQSGGVGDIAEFDPAENFQVLDWWNPQYPSSK